MKPWKRIEPTIVSKIGFRTIVSKTFKLNSGKIHHFETVSSEGSRCAGVIAMDTEKKVIVSRQFRPGPEKILDEIPGGFVDDGEELEEAARRELTEETGYTDGQMTYLGYAIKDCYANLTYHYFLATECSPVGGGQHLDDTEEAEVVRISIEQLFENAKLAKMTDSEAVFLAYEKLKEMED